MFETFVVIIGILGAFGLNNWNEDRKDRATEKVYLTRIYNDLKADTLYFNRRIAEGAKDMNGLYTMVHEMYEEQETLEDLVQLFSLTSFPTEHLSLQNFTFYELTNTGELNLFSNTNLKESLISYYRNAEVHGKHIQEYNEWSVQRFMDYYDIVHSSKYQTWGQMRLFDEPEMFKYQDWSFINDPSSEAFLKIEGVLDAYHAKIFTFDFYLKNLKNQATEILVTLEQEIK